MLYTIYKITNLINSKIYIGKHQTNDADDDYMGSGLCIRRAVNKYGIDNFEKKVIFVFDTEAAMNSKEAELVTEEFCARDDTYNICPGGQGGFGYINSVPGLRTSGHNAKTFSAISDKLTGRKQPLQSISLREQYRNGSRVPSEEFIYSFKGKTHDEKARQAISAAASVHQKGSGNSQFGKRWVSNLDTKRSKRVLISEMQWHLDNGWILGYKFRKSN